MCGRTGSATNTASRSQGGGKRTAGGNPSQFHLGSNTPPDQLSSIPFRRRATTGGHLRRHHLATRTLSSPRSGQLSAFQTRLRPSRVDETLQGAILELGKRVQPRNWGPAALGTPTCQYNHLITRPRRWGKPFNLRETDTRSWTRGGDGKSSGRRSRVWCFPC